MVKLFIAISTCIHTSTITCFNAATWWNATGQTPNEVVPTTHSATCNNWGSLKGVQHSHVCVLTWHMCDSINYPNGRSLYIWWTYLPVQDAVCCRTHPAARPGCVWIWWCCHLILPPWESQLHPACGWITECVQITWNQKQWMRGEVTYSNVIIKLVNQWMSIEAGSNSYRRGGSSLPQTAGGAHKQHTDPQTSHCRAVAHSIAHSWNKTSSACKTTSTAVLTKTLDF